jgi:murein L,D-transpeptidase YafK
VRSPPIRKRHGEPPRQVGPVKAAGRRRLALILLLLAALFAALKSLVPLAIDMDQLAIELERARRLARVSLGLALRDTPDLEDFSGRLAAHGVKLGAPVFVRIFKREFELELWLLRDGHFHRFAIYPICRWSGRLGPKYREGDHQAPEGFYTVDAKALNPESRWHRSFNLGFPNAYDRAHGSTGSLLMVHGGCSSIGCYAMTDSVIDEIWRLVTAALKNGQARFQVQVLPYRMTPANMERYAAREEAAFWKDLKRGYDLFEAEQLPPKVNVCRRRYEFEAAGTIIDGSIPIEEKCPGPAPGT